MPIDHHVIEVEYLRADVAQRITTRLLRSVIEVAMSGQSGTQPGPPPVITFLSPLPPQKLQVNGTIQFQVEDTDLVFLILTANLPGGVSEVVSRQGVFTTQYTMSTVTNPSPGVHLFTITRTGGWPFLEGQPSQVHFYVDAVDAHGQVGSDE